jgi:hypothetical protein
MYILLPSLASSSSGLVEAVALSKTARLLASGGETTRLAVLVNWVNDPVDARVAADGLVLRIDQDDLEVLVGGVLVDPVGVQNTQIGATTTNTLLGGGLERTLVLELVDTLIGWLACTEDLN